MLPGQPLVWLTRSGPFRIFTDVVSRAKFYDNEKGLVMDSEHLQAIAARDQLWSSLRSLLPEIEPLAQGTFGNTERERQVLQVLARVVVAELQFRAERAEPE